MTNGRPYRYKFIQPKLQEAAVSVCGFLFLWKEESYFEHGKWQNVCRSNFASLKFCQGGSSVGNVNFLYRCIRHCLYILWVLIWSSSTGWTFWFYLYLCMDWNSSSNLDDILWAKFKCLTIKVTNYENMDPITRQRSHLDSMPYR